MPKLLIRSTYIDLPGSGYITDMIALFLILLCPFFAVSQDLAEAIHWQFAYEEEGDTAITLYYFANVQDGFLISGPENGENPAVKPMESFFDPDDMIRKEGQLAAVSNGEPVFDQVLGRDLFFYTGKPVFKQTLYKKNGKTPDLMKGFLTYQVYDGKRNLPSGACFRIEFDEVEVEDEEVCGKAAFLE